MRKLFPIESKKFGDRLNALMIRENLNSLDLAAKLLGYSEKPKSNTKEYMECRTKERTIKNHLKLNSLDNLNSSESLSTIYLIEYSNFFHCSADYFLGYIDFPTHKTQNVYETTGLNEKALHKLDMIRLTDRNENSITLFPSELFAKMNSNKKLTPEEQKQVEEIFFDTSGKYMHPLDSHRPLLMDLMNYMLASGYIEKILIQFRNFANARFKVPVYYDNDKSSFIYPDNAYSYTGDANLGGKIYKGNYILNFASSPDNPNDNAPIYLSDTFFDTVVLKDIEKIFYEMRTDYEKEYSDN